MTNLPLSPPIHPKSDRFLEIDSSPAGIYFHIPFCRQVCYYCDFHFSLSLRDKDGMIAAMEREMALRGNYLDGQTVESLYLGGGTPSVLTLTDIERLLAQSRALFPVAANAEITLEANPDDLGGDRGREYLASLAALGINRLSIGIQSFHDHELRAMNRRHTAREGVECVENAYRCGFGNVNLDLIYGFPNSTPASWSYSLETALALSPAHLSCYHLAFEEKTAFAHFRKKGKLRPCSGEDSERQYRWLCDRMGQEGYEHYEIANFAQKGRQSGHNNGYWMGSPYLGIGPAAHSFDGKNRQWNIAHNRHYREGVLHGAGFYEREVLSERDRLHDYLLTRLRTARGIDLGYLRHHFPGLYPDFHRRLSRYLATDVLAGAGDRYRLTEKGMFRSDGIIGDLF
ncbi:MAG: oxygen-independent coproporphyrinogen-3 oxidase [Candidatus Kentron sp. G]|nr:MAG: oxygen-independent coproporphyrinogen-3 oxidase [Candidatus Kentron sp. G]VFM98165.1 MAG: oxygen-independent coproporphyrinogen-3 oxidase [Candidatus Kentron sp. G]VFM98480.1 MAG: oxygen-independent coproporphyrinogen-3 oxidase [Candidatus Kentron sp. G]